MKGTPLDGMPPPLPGDAFIQVRRLVAASGTKTVVLDDDPTGTQTVHGLDVLADWSVASLSLALCDPRPCFFLLTNTRSMPAPEAAGLVGTLAANLAEAARMTGVGFAVVSRSDSTLRGHFWEELCALQRCLGTPMDATVVIPAFIEWGRFTVGAVHYVAEGERLVPAFGGASSPSNQISPVDPGEICVSGTPAQALKISPGAKKRASSAFAFSTLSEAWTTLRIISVPKSPRIVPFGALRESVGPRRSRTLATTEGPWSTMTTTGLELMNFSISG